MEKAMKKASLWTAKSKGREASADDRPWNTFGFLQAFAGFRRGNSRGRL